MSKGNPNNWTPLYYAPKFLDHDGVYRPFYIAPDAEGENRGEVYLSDVYTWEDAAHLSGPTNENAANAATGVEAATPKAVALVRDEILTKFNTGREGVEDASANEAIKLTYPRELRITTGTEIAATVGYDFDGTQPLEFNIESIDASRVNHGTLPMSVIPQAAQERLVRVTDRAARMALRAYNITSNPSGVSNGDSVLEMDTEVMYVVIDESKLGTDDAFQKYQAATSVQAEKLADKNDVATAAGSEVNPIYFADGIPVASTSSIGTGIKPIYLNKGIITVSNNNVGSTNRPMYMSNGELKQINYTIDKSVPSTAIWVNYTGATTSAAGAAGYVPAPAANSALTTKPKYLSDDGSWKYATPIDDSITNAKLAPEVGTVAISATEPTDDNTMIWIQI